MIEPTNTMTQRNVSKQLGKNMIKDHDVIYNEIEKRIGLTKKCNFGLVKGSKTGVKHEGDQELPIRDFELRGVILNENNEVIISKGSDGLQGFCKCCEKKRRRARIEISKKDFNGKTMEEIHKIYMEKYGKNTKKCSRCDNELELKNFNKSTGMECGLHNICIQCSSEYGNSAGDRIIIYLPDSPNFKYNKINIEDHDDHIFPISLGGTNAEINHQCISAEENLSKSNDIMFFEDIKNINPLYLCKRYRDILLECNDLSTLKIKLSQAIYNDILVRSNLNDDELIILYSKYYKENNMRSNVKRAVKKLRDYCKQRKIGQML